MKKFTSIHDVTFDDLLEVLQAWEDGSLQYEEVQAWAEALYDSRVHPFESEDDKRSIIEAVIEDLSWMYTNPTLKEDIPALRQFLVMDQSSPREAWQFIKSYWETVDWEKRKAVMWKNIDEGRPFQD